jgi:2-polyprenyl-6-methoxyphenol hydroxylase-like FAD-dependent oxidoreductase
LSPDAEETETHDLQPIGIRRWKLQKILYQAVQDAGMKIHFNKGLESLELNVSSSQKGEPEAAADLIRLQFKDGTIRITKLLLGADGSKSQVRTLVSDGKYQLEYTGTTCIMGSSKVPRQVRGLCLPSSETTRCHGAFYPTGEHEQCFQFHFPTTVDQHEGHASSDHEIDPKQFSWGGLTHVVGREECNNLADKLLKDGWDEKFTIPLRNVDKALKIRCSTLEPHLESFVFAGRIALVGDSAHPPVPYLGQGAQQGLEDAGTLALLLQHFCTRRQSSSVGTSESKNRPTIFSLANVGTALKLYNQVRLPRTTETLNRSKLWGKQQQKRAENQKYNEMREENIRRDVFYHETLPILLPAVRHDYREGVITAIKAMEAKKEEQAAKQAAKQAALAQSHPASSPPNSGPGPNVDAPVDLHLLAVPEETVCY